MGITIRVGWYEYADVTGENPWTIQQERGSGMVTGTTYRARSREDAIDKAVELANYWEDCGECADILVPGVETMDPGADIDAAYEQFRDQQMMYPEEA